MDYGYGMLKQKECARETLGKVTEIPAADIQSMKKATRIQRGDNTSGNWMTWRRNETSHTKKENKATREKQQGCRKWWKMYANKC